MLARPHCGGWRCSSPAGRPRLAWRRPTARAAASSGGAAGDASESSPFGSYDEPLAKEDLGIVWAQRHGDASAPPAFPLSVPLLPFPVEEVMLPGSVKSLHLYEARYLALLDEVLASPGPNKLLGHVVVEQRGDAVGSKAAAFPGAFVGQNLVLLMGVLVRVLEVRTLGVGALVRIQAEGRVAVTEVTQAEPFIRGVVVPQRDAPLGDGAAAVAQQVEQLAATMQDVQNLAAKFRCKATAAMHHAMLWYGRAPLVPAAAEREQEPGQQQQQEQQQQERQQQERQQGPGDAADEAGGGDLAERAARLSFAALGAVPEASPTEQLKLLRASVGALEVSDTASRLRATYDFMSEAGKVLAAKVALRSLKLG
ncbi:hypothetical protein HT031_005998 [Scenedesmus sp. PABB004]|nr:hypothetical protein HT031_005998 [Scenedesmus sp. PABB004]